MSGGMYGTNAGGAGQAIFTDDVSLQVFMDVLKRLVSIIHTNTPGTTQAQHLCAGCWCIYYMMIILGKGGGGYNVDFVSYRVYMICWFF
jgi:hypothetical protein